MEAELLDAFFRGEQGFGAVGMQNLAAPLSGAPRREVPLTAYHVLSTLPFFSRNPGKEFALEEFEILTAKLSALCWRRYNGPVFMVTDPAGAKYLREKKLDVLYDGVKVLLSMDEQGIPAGRFWASSKILALGKLPLPCVILDMDLIVWEPLPLENVALAAAHTEDLFPEIYPPLSTFRLSPRYHFPQWDETVEPLNTSILYMADENLRDHYVRNAVAFMQYERHSPDNGARCMVLAEQRILAMCAAELGIRFQTFLDYDHLDAPQSLITHTWSGKGILRGQEDARTRFIQLCRQKLQRLQNLGQKTRDHRPRVGDG